MEQILAFLIGDERAPLLTRELLGRPVEAYARQALEDAGLRDISALTAEADRRALPQTLSASDSRKALFLRADAPCVTAESLLALCAQASEKQDEAFTIVIPGTQTVIALCADRSLLLRAMNGESFDSLQALTDVFNRHDVHLRAVPVRNTACCLTVDTPSGYAAAHALLRGQIVQRHLDAGVLILDPERTIIEADVRIGAGTMVYPGNLLMGKTVIGAGCTLYQNNRLQNATVGSGTTVESSVLLDCTVGERTTVGPYAYVRPQSDIGDGCRIGDFVEIKNSRIGNGTKVSHLTYVGDSDLGQHINLGCGVVFVNYDGKTKSRSTVADHAFIGCNCNLVAPVHVGENAYLAAGSTVTEDVPANALFVARSRGVTKEDWVLRRKESGKL